MRPKNRPKSPKEGLGKRRPRSPSATAEWRKNFVYSSIPGGTAEPTREGRVWRPGLAVAIFFASQTAGERCRGSHLALVWHTDFDTTCSEGTATIYRPSAPLHASLSFPPPTSLPPAALPTENKMSTSEEARQARQFIGLNFQFILHAQRTQLGVGNSSSASAEIASLRKKKLMNLFSTVRSACLRYTRPRLRTRF